MTQTEHVTEQRIAAARTDTPHLALRNIRKARDLTLAQVAERSGLSVSHLSDMEHGRCKPSFDTLATLARAYNVSWRIESQVFAAIGKDG